MTWTELRRSAILALSASRSSVSSDAAPAPRPTTATRDSRKDSHNVLEIQVQTLQISSTQPHPIDLRILEVKLKREETKLINDPSVPVPLSSGG